MEIITDAGIIAVVIGLVQVVKTLGLSTRYAPLLSVILGVVGAFLLTDAQVGLTIFHGLILGLSACGLWSSTRSTIGI